MLSADDVLTARFSSVKFQDGYDQDEVDDFLDRVALTLREAGTREPLRRDVTVDELDSVQFQATKWREGYAIAEVDAFLAELRPAVVGIHTRGAGYTPRDAAERTSPAGWQQLSGWQDMSGWQKAFYVVEGLAIGERPQTARPLVTPARAPRASVKNVVVTADGVSWRSRSKAEGRLAVAEMREVVLMDLDISSGSSSSVLIPYAVVIDHTGAARLRVHAVRGDKRLHEIWGPARLPVTRARFAIGRVKDARRRWPEAFSFLYAHPVATTLAVLGGYMGIAYLLTALGIWS